MDLAGPHVATPPRVSSPPPKRRMSSIGKIFVFVNLVLAGLFVGWAAKALNENSDWKAKHDTVSKDLSAKLDTANKDLSAVRAEKAATDQALATARGEKDDAMADLERTKATLTDTQRKLDDWSKDLNKLSATYESAVASNTKLQSEKDKAVQAQHDAEKARADAEAKQAAAQAELAAAQTTLEGANTKIADLEKELTSTSKSKKQVETQLASLQSYTGATLDGIMAMPPIEGRVLAVSMDVSPGLISINKGKDAQVTRGFTFEIYDGKKYKGKARVEFVHDTSCSAIMVYSVPGETPRQGDVASTKL